MRNLLLAASLISAGSLSSLAVALDVGGAVGGAVGAAGGAVGGAAGAVGGAARGAVGAVGGAVGAVGGAAGNAVGAVGGAASGAVGAVGGIAGGAAGAVGGVARGAVGAVGGIAGGAAGAVGGVAGTAGRAVGGTTGRSGRALGRSAAPRPRPVVSLGASGHPQLPAVRWVPPLPSPSSRQRWTLGPPRKVNTLVYFPVESLYRRKPRQIRALLVKLDRDLLRTIRSSCRQVLAAPRSFTRQHVQVCRIARALQDLSRHYGQGRSIGEPVVASCLIARGATHDHAWEIRRRCGPGW